MPRLMLMLVLVLVLPWRATRLETSLQSRRWRCRGWPVRLRLLVTMHQALLVLRVQ